MTRTQPQSPLALAKLAFVTLAITLVPQGVWSALIVANLRTSPAVPWSVLVMAVLIVVLAQYLRGQWGAKNTAEDRRQSLRATLVSREAFVWAGLAGAFSITALVGVWIGPGVLDPDAGQRSPRPVEVPVVDGGPHRGHGHADLTAV